MADTSSFTKLVPGFDFLQNLVESASSALPNMGQWVAPTLNPDELAKRIDELKTVQFWLEQNARMLSATVQALEVQRMTLSTLKTMNVQMSDLRDSLQVRVPEVSDQEQDDEDEHEDPMQVPPSSKPTRKAARVAAAPAPAQAVDPMQWWGALTKQFTELAASAMAEPASHAPKDLASGVGKQSENAGGQPPKKTEGSRPRAVAAKAAAPKPAPKRAPAKR